MLHKVDKPFQPGKRCWGLGRYKPQPTIDLEVVSFEEAVSEAGEGLGMVGRVNVRLIREWPLGEAPAGWKAVSGDLRNLWEKIVGVGPGKLTHEERTRWWNDYNVGALSAGNIYAEIKYMPDPAYEALRQPTVQRLRTDKTVSDVLTY
jgi:ATP-dependent DNA ligase